MLPPLDPLRGAGFPEDDDGGTTGSLPESMSSKHSSINRVCTENNGEREMRRGDGDDLAGYTQSFGTTTVG